MNDLISRQALLDRIERLWETQQMTNDKHKAFVGIVKAEPSVQQGEQQGKDSGGCTGCAFYVREEWEMPCEKCKRACKDYWRRGEV